MLQPCLLLLGRACLGCIIAAGCCASLYQASTEDMTACCRVGSSSEATLGRVTRTSLLQGRHSAGRSANPACMSRDEQACHALSRHILAHPAVMMPAPPFCL